MLHETSKFIRFHSEHKRKELRFHMEPVITSAMWTQPETHRMHPMVMACAVSVNPGRKASGASQGRTKCIESEEWVLTAWKVRRQAIHGPESRMVALKFWIFGNSQNSFPNSNLFRSNFSKFLCNLVFFTSELDSESTNALRKMIFKRVDGRFQLDPWLLDPVHLRFATCD